MVAAGMGSTEEAPSVLEEPWDQQQQQQQDCGQWSKTISEREGHMKV
jgi:hypothetical protein